MTDCRPNRSSGLARGYQIFRARYRAAFTLIELLIVIAIISILVALLFPVFATVMENSRESNSMSNMQQIQSALALYKLDNKRYPDVLFAYAPTGSTDPCQANMSNIGSANGCSSKLIGLYPTYISDWHVFTSPDNQVTDNTKRCSTKVNTFAMGSRTMASSSQSFFEMDAYDVSPQITGVNQTSSSVYVARYQTSWTDYTPTGVTSTLCFPDGGYANGACETPSTSTPDNTYDPDYARQLRWTNPPPDTYVTSTTDHVANANKVLVLYLDGTVKKINFQNGWQNAQAGLPVPTSTTTGFNSTTANCQTLEQMYNDSQTDIGAEPVSGVSVTVNESRAGFWRTLLGRGEH
jgi:prepilin-type N-terminal cleavage/methylation domain-containing protein